MNQISHKKLNLVYTRISIPDILEEMRSLFDYSCQLRRLYMDTEVEPGVPEIICTDKNRLSQILINLLGNAFKFTFQGGVTIKVGLESRHPLKVRFSVVDTGIGIKKEDQERLFKMYGKLEQQDKKINTNGVGLGLTISNTLAKMLNPSENANSGIQVESEVDIGTSFSFVIESQTVEPSKGKDPAASSSVDISSRMLNEDKDLTMLQKMAVYTRNNYENYTKLTTSSQNLDTRKRLDIATKTLDLDNFKESDEPYGSESGRHLLKKNTKMQEFYNDDEVVVLSSSPNEKKNLVIKAPLNLDTDLGVVQKPRRWCLVVDDNPFNLMVACHIMEERKFQVKTALNGQDAIKQVADHAQNGLTFDVILMDCQMPVMDGYEATRILKNMMAGNQVPNCPIIALTANNHDEDHEKLCNKVGMNGYVAKPLQITELEAVLKKVQKTT
jgi:CheY-like chemotaxis protein